MNNSPIFSIHQPQHFSDYGFDPQIDYFQVLEEGRKHKRESCSSRSAIDVNHLHFKLQKPISKDDSSKKIKKSRKRWWWKNAFHFFKRSIRSNTDENLHCFYGVRAVSGPVYLSDSRNGSSTPYHRTRPVLTPATKGDLHVPYINLTEFNIHENEDGDETRTPMPIYLVT